MEVKKMCTVLAMLIAIGLQYTREVSSQQTGFELPVQLVGFPFIILAVRLTNFAKKLSYSLSPATYRSRSRRGLSSLEPGVLDAIEAEKHVVQELGARACIYERVCSRYAERAKGRGLAQTREQLDWPNVFSQYKSSPDQTKEFYLLSVFLGDIVGSPDLCRQLAKRRPCEPRDFDEAAAPSGHEDEEVAIPDLYGDN